MRSIRWATFLVFGTALVLWTVLTPSSQLVHAQGGAVGSNGTSIANEQFTDAPAMHGDTVWNDTATYCFNFSATVCVTMECCEQYWIARLELWEDDTFSDDFVGACDYVTFECGETPAANCHQMSCEICGLGTAFHNLCGTGSDWEMEIRTSTSCACGDDNIDPPDWELDQPNS
ncbi:MAG: hypothetical protein BroJett014_00790 [Planctomycetota bacterium]|nr:hypothetical protein [Planctomycetota bacterium]GIK51106.1 MAG: hypothetical protein BroJett014_00790 [Planctomycetota bacterium]